MKASVPVDLEKKEAFLWACYVIRMTYSSIRGHNVSWDIKSFLQNLQHAFMTEHQYWRLVLESRKRCGPAMEPPPSRRTSPRKMLTFADHYSAWVAMYQPFLDHLFWYLKSQSDSLTPASSCICILRYSYFTHVLSRLSTSSWLQNDDSLIMWWSVYIHPRHLSISKHCHDMYNLMIALL